MPKREEIAHRITRIVIVPDKTAKASACQRIGKQIVDQRGNVHLFAQRFATNLVVKKRLNSFSHLQQSRVGRLDATAIAAALETPTRELGRAFAKHFFQLAMCNKQLRAGRYVGSCLNDQQAAKQGFGAVGLARVIEAHRSDKQAQC